MSSRSGISRRWTSAIPTRPQAARWWRAIRGPRASDEQEEQAGRLFEPRRRGEGTRGVDDEHHELVEVGRAGAEYLHRHVGAVAVHRRTRVRVDDAMRCLLPE